MEKNVGSKDFMQSFRNIWAATLLVLFGSICCSNLMAQNVSVSGSVRFTSGESVPGANVSVKGSSNGIMTNTDGTYYLTNVPANAHLIFSFIGMEQQEIAVNGRTKVDVVLKESAIVLDEVVAIGYGTAKKKDLTGSVSAIAGERLLSRQNNQVITALQGAMAGVTVTRSSSAPGASGTIRVRGVTSIQESDPLIIIDGVPANSVNDVNPADVENLTVLKDAASASIYGARAAAGVVLITTKRGSHDGMSIDYNYSLSLDVPTKMPEYADAVTYMKVLNERNWNDNNAGGEYSVYEKDLIDNYWTLNKQNSDLYPNTNWVDLCTKDYGVKNSHQIGISSGNQKSRTKVSFGYDKVDGLYVANNSWERVTARVNNDLKFKEWLTTSIDLGLKKSQTIEPAFSPSTRMRYAAPIYSAIYSDGRLAGGKDGENPYGKLLYGGNENTNGYQMNGKVSVDIKPFKDLTITGVFAPIYNFSKVKRFNKQVEYYTAWDDYTSTDLMDETNTTDLKETRSDSYSITSQIYANYNKSINKHNISATLGYETYHYFYENLWTSRGEYDISYYPYLSAGPSTLINNNGDAYENAYNSYIGRAMYNWGYKYYVQANFRYDGSSRFHKDHRWGFFPSASLGWVISKEGFMQDLEWLSFAKLRLSYGQLGNERIGNYPYQSTLSFNTGTLYQGSEIIPSQGASAYQYAIQNISWETTETIDLGLDISVLKERLRFTGDYYQKKTMDMLLQLQIPNYMGYTDPDQNAGTMSTKGWEIDLSWNDKIGDLSYGVSFNLYDSKTVMGAMNNTQVLSDGLMIKEGSEYKEWYGYVSDGIFQTAEEIASSPVTSSSVKVGDIKYKDISGAEGVPDGKIDAVYDRVLLGGSLPRYNYGGNVNLGYKGFDFLVAFQGVGKRNAMLTDDMVEPIRGDWYNVPQIIVGNYWSSYNTDEQNLNAKYPRVSRTGVTNNYAVSDFWMIDGSYFRIKNITLGYTLPRNLLSKISLQNVRFYASLQDFFTFSNYPTGWDPEVTSTGYPITKSVIFGVSVKF